MAGRIALAWARIGRLPLLLAWRRARFALRFTQGDAVGTCLGLYPDAATAAAHAPPSLPLGYNHADAAAMYVDRIGRIDPSDYPALFWLRHALDQGVRTVFDLGGHIGLSYYSYRRLITFPPELRWQVHDLPAVLDAGRRQALLQPNTQALSFVNDMAAASGSDMLFSAGCLQYLEDTLAERLSGLSARPRWVLVNLLPLHPERAYWTVQNIKTAFCPYRVQHDASFFAEMAALGYGLRDRWENAEKSCWIAFEPEHSLDRYHGALFELEPVAPGR